MQIPQMQHRDDDPPLPWVTRFACLIFAGGSVLDLACGQGRHSRYLRDRGHPVAALDKSGEALAAINGTAGIEIIQADLEDGDSWPLGDRRFAGVVVTNYLYRPILPRIVEALEPGGVLIYQTFALGNEQYGRPRSPEFLLRPGELLDAVCGRCAVIAYEHGIVGDPRPAAIQRICAVRSGTQSGDEEPRPFNPGSG